MLPAFLCRRCHPELIRARAHGEQTAPEPQLPEVRPEQAVKFERKQRRRLRAEIKRLKELKERIEGRPENADHVSKLETKINEVQRELYLVC